MAGEDSLSKDPFDANALDKPESKAAFNNAGKRDSGSKSKAPASLRIRCRCSATLSVNRSLSGKTAKCPKCPKCGHRFTIP